MNAKDAARTTMNTADFMVDSYLSDITPDEMFVRPAPGANHVAWQLGHVISAERRLVNQAGRTAAPRRPARLRARQPPRTPGGR
jgi:hypothetical protein